MHQKTTSRSALASTNFASTISSSSSSTIITSIRWPWSTPISPSPARMDRSTPIAKYSGEIPPSIKFKENITDPALDMPKMFYISSTLRDCFKENTASIFGSISNASEEPPTPQKKESVFLLMYVTCTIGPCVRPERKGFTAQLRTSYCSKTLMKVKLLSFSIKFQQATKMLNFLDFLIKLPHYKLTTYTSIIELPDYPIHPK